MLKKKFFFESFIILSFKNIENCTFFGFYSIVIWLRKPWETSKNLLKYERQATFRLHSWEMRFRVVPNVKTFKKNYYYCISLWRKSLKTKRQAWGPNNFTAAKHGKNEGFLLLLFKCYKAKQSQSKVILCLAKSCKFIANPICQGLLKGLIKNQFAPLDSIFK